MPLLQCVGFVTDERPVAFWDYDLSRKNLEYLRGIDTDFFEYVIDIVQTATTEEAKSKGALLIRLVLFQALETMFALLCASIQAPECIYGWMISYKSNELNGLVKKIDINSKLFSRWKQKEESWVNLARRIHKDLDLDVDEKQRIVDWFGNTWRYLASMFLENSSSKEHNSIKHGHRLRLGGFSLWLGIERTACANSPMMQVVRGQYGADYFVRKRINEANCHSIKYCVNWRPENDIEHLKSCSISIKNIVSFLRNLNKDPSVIEFYYPDKEQTCRTPWSRAAGERMQLEESVNSTDVKLYKKEDILNSYRDLSHP